VSPSRAFDRLSTEAKRALSLAQSEGERTASPYLGTEHLLLGVLAVERGLGAQVLSEVGIDLAAGRRMVAAAPLRSARTEVVPTGAVPTSRVKRVIEFAFDEARRSGDSVVTTGGLLIGLLLEEDGLASHLLRERGVTADTVRDALARLDGDGVSETVD
jgi:ATP-dependent Clp protease ATP-binding subunit ClpC